MVHRILKADVFRCTPDHDGQLDLPVGFFRSARDDHVIIRAANGAGRFHENDRLWRHLHAGLFCVVGIVQANANKFAHAGYRRAKAHRPIHNGQAIDVNLFEAGQRAWIKGRAAEIRDVIGQIANSSVRCKQAWLFCAGFTKPQ